MEHYHYLMIRTRRQDAIPYELTDDEGSVQICIHPLFLVWKGKDETYLHKISKWREQKQTGFLQVVVCRLSRIYFGKRYREIFDCDTATLLLSEKAEKELPDFLWKPQSGQNRKQIKWRELSRLYSARELERILLAQKTCLTLLVALPDDDSVWEIPAWLADTEEKSGAKLCDLVIFGTAEQREMCEEMLDDFYEKTGIAGSFYETVFYQTQTPLTWIGEERQESSVCVLYDAKGIPIQTLSKRGIWADYYMDAAGVRSRREIRRLESSGITCKSIRNDLDRAILSTL